MSKKSHSGIDRTYERSVTYKATTPYSLDFVEDPEGKYRDEEGKRYTKKETYAENPAFKEIRKLPVGSVVVVHIPRAGYSGGTGDVPAHNEYYEVIQRTRTIKSIQPMRTTDKRGFYTVRGSVREGKSFLIDINSTKEIQSSLRDSDRITIKRKK